MENRPRLIIWPKFFLKKKIVKIIKKKERIEEVGNLRISINKAIKLGWKPKISLKNGLKRLYIFMKNIKIYDNNVKKYKQSFKQNGWGKNNHNN